MAKLYSVTPILRPGAKSYSATFYAASGKRVTRGLGTRERGVAITICDDLVKLRNAGARKVSDRIAGGVCVEAEQLYFETDQPRGESVPIGEEEVPDFVGELDGAINALPIEYRAQLAPRMMKIRRLESDRNDLHKKLSKLEKQYEAERAAHEHLKRTTMARIAAAAEKAPAIAADVLNVGDITAAHAIQFLDARTGAGNVLRAQSRRHAWRMWLSRFFSWIQNVYNLPSIMAQVPAVSKQAILRERGDIHWHRLEEVETAIAAAPSEYWKTLIATLAYAGLQLAELCWLRIADLEFSADRKRAKLWITTVDDPENAAARHLLKTNHRRRHVDVHPDLLRRLRRHIDDGRAGKVFLFPMILPKKRRRLVNVGSGERWIVSTLSTVLRGHKGGKKIGDTWTRKPMAGLLPKGMNAKSLRRTFGSLLLRSGKSTAEVAAAMGNTEQVVRENYARILGGEVTVDF